MEEKELRKLNRYQLLELLIMQTKRADQLQKKLEEAEEKLNNKEIDMAKLGSIAEASLEVNNVFVSAQKAADMYIKNAKNRAFIIESNAKEEAKKIIEEAKLEALHTLK